MKLTGTVRQGDYIISVNPELSGGGGAVLFVSVSLPFSDLQYDPQGLRTSNRFLLGYTAAQTEAGPSMCALMLDRWNNNDLRVTSPP